jgi:hypothetical protein
MFHGRSNIDTSICSVLIKDMKFDAERILKHVEHSASHSWDCVAYLSSPIFCSW